MRPALAYELDAYIAAALKQYSLHRVLDAIGNACRIKVEQAGDAELQKRWSQRLYWVLGPEGLQAAEA
jgi:hypothetical protein